MQESDVFLSARAHATNETRSPQENRALRQRTAPTERRTSATVHGTPIKTPYQKKSSDAARCRSGVSAAVTAREEGNLK